MGEVGGYSVHVYEIQCNGELGHRRRELPDITVDKIKQETNNTCTKSAYGERKSILDTVEFMSNQQISFC